MCIQLMEAISLESSLIIKIYNEKTHTQHFEKINRRVFEREPEIVSYNLLEWVKLICEWRRREQRDCHFHLFN